MKVNKNKIKDKTKPQNDRAIILDKVYDFLGRFISYPDEYCHIAHTLWVAHSHLMDLWESTPRIAFLSPEPESGKTRALEVTATLVPRPVEAVNASSAYIYRKIGEGDGLPTILYDEIDTVFGPKAKENEELRGLLNAGHRRGAITGRCVIKGRNIETEDFPAFCAVAMAGLGNLPDSILSRCVIIRMRRRSKTDKVTPWRGRIHEPEGEKLNSLLESWAESIKNQIVGKWPEFPPGIEDRSADMWEPLLLVAEATGGQWPERARVAAVTLVTISRKDSPSFGIRLLSDLRELFGENKAMSTDEILISLNSNEEAPWGDLNGVPLDARKLGKMLKQYGIKSTSVRIDEKVKKGYKAETMHDAWSRYLPPSLVEGDTSDTKVTKSDRAAGLPGELPMNGYNPKSN